jgi:hypothetical protein
MFKRSALVFALLGSIMSFTSMASLITTTQAQNHSGTAGDKSVGAGGSASDFQFLKFDTSLGVLDNVFIKYIVDISDGLIGADNKTNSEVTVSGVLGGAVILTSNENMFFQPSFANVFTELSTQHDVEFTLAADPNESTGPGGGTGGTGDDIGSFNGTPKSEESAWFNISNMFMPGFVGGAGDTTFDVFFNTTSITTVSSASTQGFFETVDIGVEMQLYYEYTAAPAPVPPVGVPEPAVFAFGLLMLCAVTGRKFIK